MSDALIIFSLIVTGAVILLLIALAFGGTVALVTLIVSIVLFILVRHRISSRNSKLEEAWIAAKQANSEHMVRIEKQREKCREELSDECFKITNRHRHALVKKYIQMVTKDDYGIIVGLDKWEKEISYFFENVILIEPTIHEKIGRCTELEEEFETALRRYMTAEELRATPRASLYNEDVTILRTLIGNWIKHIAEEKNEQFGKIDFETMPGAMFEIFCQDALENSGWSVVRKAGTGDQGVDLIAKRDGVIIAIQCKRYSKPVGNKAVQEVEAGRQFEQANRAAVVSTADYTPAARQLAASLGVLLLHHEDLKRLHEIIVS